MIGRDNIIENNIGVADRAALHLKAFAALVDFPMEDLKQESRMRLCSYLDENPDAPESHIWNACYEHARNVLRREQRAKRDRESIVAPRELACAA